MAQAIEGFTQARGDLTDPWRDHSLLPEVSCDEVPQAFADYAQEQGLDAAPVFGETE